MKLPDLILIDGGKGQLMAAASILDELSVKGGVNKPLLISLAKREEEIFGIMHGDIVKMNNDYDKSSPAMRILRLARDEAHETAITYHRYLRSQTNIGALK